VHDFSGVRVHTDTKAAESARAVNALAYTVGRDIVFGVGQYMPNNIMGKRMLAHELTHIVQQGQALPITYEPTLSIPRVAKTQQVRRMQLQPQKNPPQIKLRGTKIRYMVIQKGAELLPIINKIGMNDKKYHTVIERVVNGKKVAWLLQVCWLFQLSSQGYIKCHESRRGEEYKCDIAINPFFWDVKSPPDEPVQRQAWMESRAAETLYHELIHFKLMVERSMPAAVSKSSYFEEYSAMLQLAKSSELEPWRLKTLAILLSFIADAELYGNKSGEENFQARKRLADETFRWLVEEKYVNQKAAMAFDRVPDNKLLAQSYSKSVVNDIKAKKTVSDETWNYRVIQLENSVLSLYRRIDSMLIGPLPEISPPLMHVKSTPRAEPVTIGGELVRLPK